MAHQQMQQQDRKAPNRDLQREQQQQQQQQQQQGNLECQRYAPTSFGQANADSHIPSGKLASERP